MKRRNFIASLLALPFVSALFGTSEAKPPLFANPEIPSAGESLLFPDTLPVFDNFYPMAFKPRFCPFHSKESMKILPNFTFHAEMDYKAVDATYLCLHGDYQETVRFTDGYKFGGIDYAPKTEVIETIING